MKKQSWQQWARQCAADPSSPSLLAKGSLAALTGQDMRALSAIVACFELYASSDDDGQRGALEAVRALLPAMQASTLWIARELIPFALDWSDRERLWPLVVDGERLAAIGRSYAREDSGSWGDESGEYRGF